MGAGVGGEGKREGSERTGSIRGKVPLTSMHTGMPHVSSHLSTSQPGLTDADAPSSWPSWRSILESFVHTSRFAGVP